MLTSVKSFITDLQKRGLPLIFIRNNKGDPSITLTATVISFVMCVVALFTQTSEQIGGLNFDNSLNLFITSSLLYLGRGLQADKVKTIKENIDE